MSAPNDKGRNSYFPWGAFFLFKWHHTVISSVFVKEDLFVLGFNDTSTRVGHFLLSSREREKRDSRDSRGDEREGQGRKRKNE